jgi:hypothetical protein
MKMEVPQIEFSLNMWLPCKNNLEVLLYLEACLNSRVCTTSGHLRLVHICGACGACGVVNRICGKNDAAFVIQKIFQTLDILNM